MRSTCRPGSILGKITAAGKIGYRGNEMQRSFKVLLLLTGLLMNLFLAACGTAERSNPAATAVQDYLAALVQKEENNMISLSCADWERQAKLEFDSFAAVKVALEGPDCSVSGQDGKTTLVKCNGKIIASYGEEDLVIELGDRTYQVVNEGGEWRMCGYR
jgi:hypothetical protein